ncbi:MAG: DUF4157 domain-containing protein [Phormidium tanganyikae FI6-MK23]|jgi:hypothetical protein|nr:DUF4157 domain-containing protein [Phormidium tanganyikae FI6-MK23]
MKVSQVPSIQRLCSQCENEVQRQPKKPEDEETLQMKSELEGTPELTSELQDRISSIQQTGGQPLDADVRDFFEPRFGHSFSQVKVHHDEQAAEVADGINARAFTIGQNIVFNTGQYEPRSTTGKHLLAHELTHVIQQGKASKQPTQSQPSPIQRTLGNGHDLASPRFSKLLDLEAAYDDETIIREGSTGRSVQAIQQSLYDIGIRLPNFGADGDFGRETKAAVKTFQRRNPPLVDDGEVGPLTMAVLDARFPTPTLPPAADLAAPWSKACIRSVLCPWSPHTINVLRTRITLKSFDNIFWTDERWDGAAWVPDIFPGGGYNTGSEIGVLNSSCEAMSETLYHEVLHAEQPRTHRTTQARESYAYRIGEEFSIAMGLGGRSDLRTTDAAGREFADRTKVDAFVASEYPSVAAGGGGDEIIGKAATHGHVIVQRPNGSTYTRPAVVGEKVPGPITLVNEVVHPRIGWTCP